MAQCIFKFPAITHACQAVYAFSWKRVVRILILHPASHQSPKSKNSLVLLQLSWRQSRTNGRQYRIRRQPPWLTGAIFPPRLDWVANYRPAYVSVSVDLTTDFACVRISVSYRIVTEIRSIAYKYSTHG